MRQKEIKITDPQQANALLSEFLGNASTLNAVHKPSVLFRINKNGLMMYRRVAAKKFQAQELVISDIFSVLAFPDGGKLLFRLDEQTRQLFLESDTRRYGPAFHLLALQVIDCVYKNMNAPYSVQDHTGYFDNRDEAALVAWFQQEGVSHE